MIRLKYLGKAIWDLFTMNWDGFKKGMSDAFAGGFFDEAKKNAEDSVDTMKEEIELGKLKRKLIVDEANAKKEIAQLDYNARNMDEDTKLGATQKLENLKIEIEKTKDLFNTRKNIADAEANIQLKKINQKGGMDLVTGDEKTKYSELVAAKTNIETEFIEWKTGKQRLMGRLQKQLDTEELQGIKDKEEAGKLYLKNIEKTLVRNLTEKFMPKMDFKLPTVKKLDFAGLVWDPKTAADEFKNLEIEYKNGLITWEEYEKKKTDITKKYADLRKQKEQNIADSIGMGIQTISNIFEISKNKELTAAGNNAAKREQIEKKYANKQKSINIATAIMNGAVAFTRALELPPPFNWIEAGLIGAMTATQVGVIASQKFANGGIVGGYSFSGDRVPAMVNSGEMVLNRGQQTNLFDLLNNGGSIGGGNVKFEIEGAKLVGVLANNNRRIQNFR
jgi:hypothetical protein